MVLQGRRWIFSNRKLKFKSKWCSWKDQVVSFSTDP